MTPRQELLLAYGICEYQTTLDHFRALRSVGVDVPYSIDGRVQREQTQLINYWSRQRGSVFLPVTAVAVSDARQWLREHLTELDDLLREERDDRTTHDGAGQPST